MAQNGKSAKKLIAKIFRRERYVKTNEREFDRYDKVNRQEETIDASNKIERILRKVKRRLDRSFGFAIEAKLPPMSSRQKVNVARVTYLSGHAIQLTFAQPELDYEGWAVGDIAVFLNSSLKGQNLAVVNVPDSTHLLLEDSTTGTTPAVAAHYTGTPTGASTPVTITANTAGTGGNITLNFDGTSTITATISAWNIAHPSNMLTLTSGVGTQVPSAGSVNLTGGTNEVELTASNITVRININGSKRSYV